MLLHRLYQLRLSHCRSSSLYGSECMQHTMNCDSSSRISIIQHMCRGPLANHAQTDRHTDHHSGPNLRLIVPPPPPHAKSSIIIRFRARGLKRPNAENWTNFCARRRRHLPFVTCNCALTARRSLCPPCSSGRHLTPPPPITPTKNTAGRDVKLSVFDPHSSAQLVSTLYETDPPLQKKNYNPDSVQVYIAHSRCLTLSL